jgi:hypothetical protein
MILKASLFANGCPLSGSRYLAGAPVTAQTKDTESFAFEEPATTGILPVGVSTYGYLPSASTIFVFRFLG